MIRQDVNTAKKQEVHNYNHPKGKYHLISVASQRKEMSYICGVDMGRS